MLAWLWAALAATESIAPVIGLHKNTPQVNAFIHARIVQAPGKVLERATLVVRDGCMEAVGADVAAPPDAVVRDLDGKTLYPGFMDMYTRYGIRRRPVIIRASAIGTIPSARKRRPPNSLARTRKPPPSCAGTGLPPCGSVGSHRR